MMLKPVAPKLINVPAANCTQVAASLQTAGELKFFRANEYTGLSRAGMAWSVAFLPGALINGEKIYIAMRLAHAFAGWEVTVLTESQAKKKLTSVREGGKLVGYDGATHQRQNQVVHQVFTT